MKLSIHISTVLLAVLGASVPALADPDDAGLWLFKDVAGSKTLADFSYNENIGLLGEDLMSGFGGTPAWIVPAPGLRFDASTNPPSNPLPDRVTIEGGLLISPELEPAHIYLEAVIKVDPNTLRDYGYFVAKGGDGKCKFPSYALYVHPNSPAPQIKFIVSDGTGFQASPSYVVADNLYHTYIGTFDGSVIRLKVDGVEIGTGTTAPAGYTIKYDWTVAGGNDDLLFGTYDDGACKLPQNFDMKKVRVRNLDAGPPCDPNVSPNGVVKSFRLWDASDDHEPKVLRTFLPGSAYCVKVGDFAITEFNIEAVVVCDNRNVGSVRLMMTGDRRKTQTEGAYPWFVFGDSYPTKGKVFGRDWEVGTYTVSARPWSGGRGNGVGGVEKSFTLQVKNSCP